jgi:DNA-binding response OmpR family regulator
MTKRILIAEPEVKVQIMFRDYLLKSEYQAMFVNDGKDALDRVEMQLFDLYYISIELPVVNGLELMAKIKEIQPLAVIILIADYTNVDKAANALAKGAFHYLTKPIEPEELTNSIDSGLRQSGEVDEVGGISPASLEFSRELIDLLLLKGFTVEQQHEFQQLGTLITYQSNEKVNLTENPGTMIWVESGRLAVCSNGNQVDTLRPGDLWGEETFIGTNSIFTDLIALTDSQIRHFSRKRLLEYFTYSDESLIKRFMINLIQCLYFKWRKAVMKIGSAGFNSFNLPNN